MHLASSLHHARIIPACCYFLLVGLFPCPNFVPKKPKTTHMKNTNEVLRQQARNEFFSTNANLADIADKVGVTRQTVSIWATEGNWQALKINSMRTPAILVDGMYAELPHWREFGSTALCRS